MYRFEYMTEEEKQAIKDAIQKAYDGVHSRCKAAGLDAVETSASCHGIQDFLGDIDCDENGPVWNDVE